MDICEWHHVILTINTRLLNTHLAVGSLFVPPFYDYLVSKGS
jgi:hypothetical protein